MTANYQRLRNKIIESRTRLMSKEPFCAFILMYLQYAVDKDIKNISTNGKCVFFSAKFFEKLYPSEVDFILCHTALHIAFGHLWQPKNTFPETYHHACDMQINSFLHECGFQKDRYPHLGKVYKITELSADSSLLNADDIMDRLPYRLESFSERDKSRFLFDNNIRWEYREDAEKRYEIILKPADDPFAFFIRSFQESEEPNKEGKIGIEIKLDEKGKNTDKSALKTQINENDKKDNETPPENILKSAWKFHLQTAQKIEKQLRRGKGIGTIIESSKRNPGKRTTAKTDWKKEHQSFIREQPYDYSFLPPDRRFSDLNIFLPDFNEKEMAVKNVLFMVDTSGSFSDDMIAMAFSEIEGALEQFNGMLAGKVGFFDTQVHSVTDFSSVSELKNIIPIGGGGTDFCVIFDYIQQELLNDISFLVILTDGYAVFPQNTDHITYPVLWLINNDEIDPPFGKTGRILENNKLY